MKLFIDTANLDEIREIAAWGVLDGVTTNPSLIAREGGDFVATIYEICNIVQGPTSAEVVAQDTEGMVREGRLLARIHEHVVVKVPLTAAGIAATRQLSDVGIRVRVFDTANADVTITNNEIGTSTLNNNEGIEIQTRSGTPTLCLDIRDNTCAAGDDYVCRRDAGTFKFLNIGAGTFTAPQVDAFIEANNTGSAASTGSGYTQCTSIVTP